MDTEAQRSEVVVPDHQEPREAYMEHIFNSPSQFSTEVVLKAIKVLYSLQLIAAPKQIS